MILLGGAIPGTLCMDEGLFGYPKMQNVYYERVFQNREENMAELVVKYNELTAEQFIELWETVWGDGPSLEQTELAMNHTLFRVSVWDEERLVAMARMNGDMGTDIFVELCAEPDKIPFYQRFGFDANEEQRLRMFHHVE